MVCDPRAATAAVKRVARESLTSAAQLLEDLRLQRALNVIHVNTALAACGKAQNWQMALFFLDFLQSQLQPDEFSYGSAMKSCGAAWETSLLLLNEMHRMTVAPNEIILSSCISCLSSAGRWQMALDVLSFMPTQRLRADVICCNTALGMPWLRASELAASMAQQLRLDVFSYSTLLRRAPWAQAASLMLRMLRAQVAPDNFCFSSFAMERPWRCATLLLEQMARCKVEANAVTFNALATAHWQTALDSSHRSATRTASIISRMTGEWRQATTLFAAAGRDLCRNALMNHLPWQIAWEQLEEAASSGQQPDGMYRSAALSVKDSSSWAMALQVPLDAYGCSGISSKLEWQQTLRLLQAMRLSAGLEHESSEADAGCYNSAINACKWRIAWQLLNAMPMFRLQQDDFGFSAAVSAADWPFGLSLLCGMAQRRIAGGAACNAALSASEKNSLWQQTLALATAMPFTDATCSTAIAACENGMQQLGLVLIHEAEAGGMILRAGSLLEAFSRLGVQDPEAIHAALVQALIDAAEAAPSCRDIAQLWRSAGLLGACSEKFHKVLTGRTRLSDMSLEQLVLVAWGVAALQSRVLILEEIQLELLTRLRMPRDWQLWRQNVLGVLHACSFAGRLSSRCLQQSALALRSLGQRLDSAGGPGLPAIRRGRRGAGPTVELDLSDRLVLLKPVDWEVHDENVEQQAAAFLRDMGLQMPILADKEFGQGFLHRLDVPSSGLLLVAKSYEAHCDLSLQLAAGWLERDYTALSHGWASRREVRAQVYWRRSPVTRAGGRGKPALTKVRVLSHFARPLALSLLSIRIMTGRQHQIRTHCAHVGHPLLTDGKYSSSSTYASDQHLSSHNALHRHRLAFRDRKNQVCEVTAALNPEFASVLEQLGSKSSDTFSAARDGAQKIWTCLWPMGPVLAPCLVRSCMCFISR
ncbi:unnamed protein product [Effrenium voratum]|nr:unnamed protein product [Effrenium voratum]